MNAWDILEKPVAHIEGPAAKAGKSMLSPANALQPLALPSMFWRPNYLTESAWLEHVPFAFWLIEAHRPRLIVEVGSGPPIFYFSFCQAIEKLELESTCVRIGGQVGSDSREAAADDDEARAYNASQYSAFSRMETGDIRAARHQFEDGSIDLLHIADSADMISSGDIADWLPKLSARGVLLVHGAAEPVPAPARRTPPNLRLMHPTFEFSYGNGLTLIATGAEQPEFVKLLCMASGNPHAKRALHDVFFRLGRACADSHAVTAARARSHRLNESIAEYRRRVEAVQAELRDAELRLSSRTRELEDARQQLGGQLEQRAAERGRLSEKITVLQEVRVDLKSQVEAFQARADEAAATLVARAGQVGRLEQEIASHQARINELQGHLAQRDAAMAELQARVDALQGALRDLETERAVLLQAREALEERASKSDESLAALRRDEGALRQQMEASRETARAERDGLEVQVSGLQADLKRSVGQVGTAQRELADLTRFLADAEQKLELAEDRQAKAEESASALRVELVAVAEQRDLQARKADASAVRIKALYGQLVHLQKELDKATGGAGRRAAGVEIDRIETLEDQCKVILQSGLFDAEWYLDRYRDVAQSGGDPLRHYLQHGATELRDPGPYFSTAAYLTANGEQLPEAVNPLLNYLAGEARELGHPDR